MQNLKNWTTNFACILRPELDIIRIKVLQVPSENVGGFLHLEKNCKHQPGLSYYSRSNNNKSVHHHCTIFVGATIAKNEKFLKCRFHNFIFLTLVSPVEQIEFSMNEETVNFPATGGYGSVLTTKRFT